MTKVAVVTDSNSGITQEESKNLAITVIPMPFTVDGETFFEDIDLSQDGFYAHLSSNADVATSQPLPGHITDVWDKLLETHDEVVYLPMSSGLSGSYQTAKMLSEDYDGKVEVVNNQRISVTLRQSVIDAMELIKVGHNAQEVREILEEDKFNSSIYIMLDTLFYLKKGGRITPAAAALGTILKLKPVLQIQGEKLDAFAKARTISQAKSIMMNAIQNDFEHRFGTDYKGMHIQVAHTHNEEAAIELRSELLTLYPGSDIIINPLSLSVACHIGPGSLAIACCKKMNYK